jgi:hypothetical protein
MKVLALFTATLAVASAFAPAQVNSRSSTELNALFDDVFGMDLFAPKKDQNNYGARTQKKLTVGQVGSNSYVPDGLTLEQYKKIRSDEAAKKDANYKRNQAKAFKFVDFTQFYLKRGTDENGKWLKSAGRGHTFAKTKYDFSGQKNEVKSFESAKK